MSRGVFREQNNMFLHYRPLATMLPLDPELWNGKLFPFRAMCRAANLGQCRCRAFSQFEIRISQIATEGGFRCNKFLIFWPKSCLHSFFCISDSMHVRLHVSLAKYREIFFIPNPHLSMQYTLQFGFFGKSNFAICVFFKLFPTLCKSIEMNSGLV